MRNKGIVIGYKLKYLCYHNPRKKVIYDVNNRVFAPLVKDMYEGDYKIFEYPSDEGYIDDIEKEQVHKKIRQDKARKITEHIDNRPCDMDYILKYCHFFGCSSDYLLGLADRPTTHQKDINKRTGLSDDAIRTLLSSPETKLVCNSLLETNSINSLIEYLETITTHESINTYVLNNIYNGIKSGKNKSLYGVSLKKYKDFQDTLEIGEKKLKDDMASVCIDMLCRDEGLMEYFKNKSLSSLEDDAKKDIDITFWGKQLEIALAMNNKALADDAEKKIIALSSKPKKQNH